jgi:DNA-binding transcriptional ArsR family regulator
LPSTRSALGQARARVASAPVFAALGDETRLGLVFALGTHGRLSTTRLTAGTRVSRQAVTKHLRLLEGAGLVRAARQGRERLWELAPDGLRDARGYLDAVSKQWDAALGRLQAFVER